jgi:hypothetical protein
MKANPEKFQVIEITIFYKIEISFKKILKKIGPSIEPWGTPL